MMLPPLTIPTNQEFTTVSMEEALTDRFNDTLFIIRIEGGKAGTGIQKSSRPVQASSQSEQGRYVDP